MIEKKTKEVTMKNKNKYLLALLLSIIFLSTTFTLALKVYEISILLYFMVFSICIWSLYPIIKSIMMYNKERINNSETNLKR